MNDPKPIFKLSATQLERFWKRVDKSGSCWLWMGKPNRDGYGDVKFSNEIFRAHRVAYTVAIGDIPPKLVIDHLCRVRMCVNPAHLEPVTSQENTARGQGQGRPKIKPGEERTHCKKGHALRARTSCGRRADTASAEPATGTTCASTCATATAANKRPKYFRSQPTHMRQKPRREPSSSQGT